MADPDGEGGRGHNTHTTTISRASFRSFYGLVSVAGPDGGGGQNSPSTLEILIQIVYNCGGGTPLFEA